MSPNSAGVEFARSRHSTRTRSHSSMPMQYLPTLLPSHPLVSRHYQFDALNPTYPGMCGYNIELQCGVYKPTNMISNYFLRCNGDYLNTTGIYNCGTPDVAANGNNVAIDLWGRLGTQGGTSVSAPIFAALVKRVSEQMLTASNTSVGV
ncbi:hypothetical protein BKA67DRAFT_537678 [Truncatella angustata]|uniref:Peptidase S8/S53 domain-containing protein n=1 Tax=Truncatella angustata TaxID=152316 RepID=A0A9P8ZVC1_9PEZI|nr:uncharacterized protein BKA67DRAFT_537678 [Truncatella angustata]KAH6651826.1 hypothetical protein BKA67DRAFT_537678 [Truncatella angustata]